MQSVAHFMSNKHVLVFTSPKNKNEKKNMVNETQNTTKEGLNNEPDIVIPVLASNIGFIAAMLCFIFGSIINGVAMFVILKSRRVRKHNTTPLLFFQSLNDFGYCFILLPLEAVRLANIYFIQN